MPIFGHIFFGFSLLVPLMLYRRDKFPYKIAFIFLINNLYGPDIVGLFFITPFHSILGFVILAIPYSLVFTYASRFSLHKSEDGVFPLKLDDSGIREVNWKNAYCATAAGGFSHFFIDQFFHFEGEMTLWSTWPDIIITYEEMLAWGGEAYHVISPIMIIGEIFTIIVLILSLYFFKKGYKQTAIMFSIVTALAILLMLIFSQNVFWAEREYAVLGAVTIYFLVPLLLLMYSAREVEFNPRTIPDEPRIQRKTLINIVAGIGIIVAIFFIIYSSVAIFMADMLLSLIGDAITTTKQSLQFIGYFYGTLAFILLIGSIGLFFKHNLFRYMVIAVSCYFLIFGFPFAIALFLNEKEVKEIFNKKD